ncbi:GNAT family N-acetyltransferase [Ruegeria profundi]|uniref:GNAT family N-acetyltransferase n=1 Tax=Ruegeria profundi TaxID=1685378 RepID=UPI001CD4CA5E|nr:N-acetyltransferase [Ruegeria profundi]MCA0929728.1 GNAT family N-acetyltransferase [Ruegeria profundi]
MIVREMVKKDIPDIIELSRQLAAHVKDPDPKLTAETVEELAFGPKRWFEALVVELDHRIVGFAAYTQSFELHTNSKILLVTDIAVSEKTRRIGIGQRLLEFLCRIACERECNALKFEVWKENEQARAFYSRHLAQVVDDVDMLRIAV